MAIVLTGPQGIIKVTDPTGVVHTIGRVRNLQVSSDFQRDVVTGIGSVGPKELPLIRWQGQVSCEQYAVFTSKALLYAFDCTEQDQDIFWNFLLFENGVDIAVTSKRPTAGQPEARPQTSEFVYANLDGCFITNEGWSMGENAIWGRNGSFALLQPPRVLRSQLPSYVDPQRPGMNPTPFNRTTYEQD